MKVVLGFIIVIILIISLYIGIISIYIYLFSLVYILGIKIDSWHSLFLFSFCIILFAIPYVFLSILESIPIINNTLKIILEIVSKILTIVIFTLYILFLDEQFDQITLSSLGVISIVIFTLLVSKCISKFGSIIEAKDKKQD